MKKKSKTTFFKTFGGLQRILPGCRGLHFEKQVFGNGKSTVRRYQDLRTFQHHGEKVGHTQFFDDGAQKEKKTLNKIKFFNGAF